MDAKQVSVLPPSSEKGTTMGSSLYSYLRCCCCCTSSGSDCDNPDAGCSSFLLSAAAAATAASIPSCHYGFASIFLTAMLKGLPLPASAMQQCIKSFEKVKDLAVFGILLSILTPVVISIGLLTVPKLCVDLPLLATALFGWIAFSLYTYCQTEGRLVFSLHRGSPGLLGLPPKRRSSLNLPPSPPVEDREVEGREGGSGGVARYHEDSWCTVSSSVSLKDDDVAEVAVEERHSDPKPPAADHEALLGEVAVASAEAADTMTELSPLKVTTVEATEAQEVLGVRVAEEVTEADVYSPTEFATSRFIGALRVALLRGQVDLSDEGAQLSAVIDHLTDDSESVWCLITQLTETLTEFDLTASDHGLVRPLTTLLSYTDLNKLLATTLRALVVDACDISAQDAINRAQERWRHLTQEGKDLLEPRSAVQEEASRVLANLRSLLFSVVATQETTGTSDLDCCLQNLICCEILLDSVNAVPLFRELLLRNPEGSSVGFLECFLELALRCAVAPCYWEVLERLLEEVAESGAPAPLKVLLNAIWLPLMECKMQWGMVDGALRIFQVCYCGGFQLKLSLPHSPDEGNHCTKRAVAQIIDDLVVKSQQQQQQLFLYSSPLQLLPGVLMDLEKEVAMMGGASGATDVYNEMLRALCLTPDQGGLTDILDVLFQHLADWLWVRMRRFQALDSRSYEALVCLYCRRRRLSRALEALNEMEGTPAPPPPFLYEEVLLCALKSLEIAWPLLEKAFFGSSQTDKKLSVALCKLLRSPGSITEQDRRRLLIKLIDSGGDMQYGDSDIMGDLIDYCVNSKDLQRLNHLAHQLQAAPSITFHSCTLVIRAYGRLGAFLQLDHFWKELTVMRHLIPPRQCCMAMLEVLVSNGRVRDGVAVLEELAAAGAEVTAAFYAVLIRGCGSQNNNDDNDKQDRSLLRVAMHLYDSMRLRGVSCNEVTYNTLVNTCVSHGDLRQAERVYSQMVASECKPDVVTYSTLIKGWCAIGRLDRAVSKFREMQARGVAADTIVFNTLMEGTTKKQDVPLAELLLDNMAKSKVPASSHTLTILIKLYGRAHMLEKVFALVRELPKRHNFTLDAYVYTALISACLINKQTEAALQVFDAMNRDASTRGKVTPRIYGTIIVGCLKAQQPFRASHYVMQAEQRGLAVSPTMLRQVRIAIPRNAVLDALTKKQREYRGLEQAWRKRESVIAQLEETASALSQWLLDRELHASRLAPPVIPPWILELESHTTF